MSSPLKVKIIDTLSEETLFECTVEEMESAYQQAAQYEEMGLDVKIIAPSITQTLTNTLGMSHDEEEEYQNSVVAEMEDHDGSCCAEPSQIHAGDPDKVQ
ncbi:MAG: hypothetical protein KC478_02345 [Bacteriovoracaceae bacterium]|nr:hypothetical protein [Bacteriovoracaceae bacterium]